MKWSQLKTLIIGKTPLSKSEFEDEDKYNANAIPLANECLTLIANSIKPCVKTAEYHIHKNDIGKNFKLPEDFLNYSDYGNTRWSLATEEDYEIVDDFPLAPAANVLYVRLSDCLGQKYDTLGTVVETREDVTIFRDDICEVGYTSDMEVTFDAPGTYQIYYEGLYPEIEKSNNTVAEADQDINVPKSVLNLVPYYVAGELLYDEDPTRAIQLKNSFEVMAQRLAENSYIKHTKPANHAGWY